MSVGVGVVALAIVTVTSPSYAAWAPTIIVNAPGTQFLPAIVGDGAGGAIVAWYDNRSGAGEVYVHHFLTSDVVDPAWPVNGLFVSADSDNPDPAIASDGAGGAIVFWIKGAAYDLYAHHVLASGVLDPSWPVGGVPVCTAPNNQLTPRAVSDGAGGAIVTWLDYRLVSDRNVFAHRVLASGTVAPGWPINGLGVSTQPGDEGIPVAVSDGSGGIIIAWEDFRNGADYDVYAQRILPTGSLSAGWPAGGKALSGNGANQEGPRICGDGAGGAIVAWSDDRNGNYDVFGMRVLASGALGQGWQNGGEALCEAVGDQTPFGLTTDASGGAVISWYDFRAGDGFSDIYVQRVTAAGAVSWTADGVAMCTAPNYQISPSVGTDGLGGAYLVWKDRRHETTNFETELYVHHVLGSGSPDPAWPANGGRVTYDGFVDFGGDNHGLILPNGTGGAAVFWSGVDLHAMNVNSTWTPLHGVSLSISPSGSGSVSKNPDRPSYPNGSNLTLTATPATGYGFANWSGDASGTTNPLAITVNGGKAITANFIGYTVSVQSSPREGGTVTRSPDQSTYAPGTQVTLTAIPGAQYEFSNWSGDDSGTTNPFTITVDGDKAIQAVFVTTTDVGGEEPISFALGRIHPNPGPGAVVVEYSLARESRVALRVFDVAGREVARLVDGVRPAGRHSIGWNGTHGQTRVRAGVYVVRFETPEGSWSKRLVLLR